MKATCRSMWMCPHRGHRPVGLGWPARWRGGLSVLLGALLLAVSLPARAAAPPPAVEVDAWGKREGLPQGTVTSLARDEQGYLWTGTFAGLYRFSGVGFEEQVAPAEIYAQVARITALHAEDAGLWVGVEDGGIWRFQDGTYRAVEQPDDLSTATVWTILSEPDGSSAMPRLLVGTSKGLWRRTAPDTWERLTDQSAISVLPIGHDTYWVGNHVALWQVVGGHSRPNVLSGSFYGLWQDPEGDVWAATRQGPVLIPRSGAPVAAVGWTDRVLVGTVPRVDSEKYLWMGSEQGLVRLGKWATVKAAMMAGTPLEPELIPLDSPVRSLLVDSDDTVWVGTNAAGLRRATSRPFTRLPLPDGIRGYTTGPLAHVAGRTWISLDCDHLVAAENGQWVDGIDVSDSPVPESGARCVHSLAARADGSLFVGLPDGVWHVHDGAWTAVLRDQLRAVGGYPSLLEVDAQDRLWVGSSEGLLLRSAPGDAQSLVNLALPEAATRVLSRVTLPDDRVAVGTDDGLWVQEASGWVHYGCAAGFACGPVRDLYLSADGVVWAATYGGGLGWFHDGAVGRVSPAEHGLGDGFLSSVSEGVRGKIWIHGNRGLYSLGPSELRAARMGELDALRLHHFDVGEANGWALPSSWTGADGTLWLVTVDGLVSFSTGAVEETWKPGMVDIHGIKVGHVLLQTRGSGPIVISPELGDTLEVRYSAPVLRPDQVGRFSYRLVRLDSAGVRQPFSEPMARNSVTFAGLTPGRYRFEVRSVGADNTHGELASVELEVEQAWYASPMLPVMLTLGTLLFAAGVVVVRLRMVEARTRHLAEEVAEQREVEERLEQQRRFYQQVFDSAGVALLLFDARGGCLEVNREACALFGADRAVLLQWTPAHLGLETARSDGLPGRCRRPDGSSFPARVVSASFVAEGQRRFLVSVSDLSSLLAEQADYQGRRLKVLLEHTTDAVSRFVQLRAVQLEQVLGAALGQASLAGVMVDEAGAGPEATGCVQAIQESVREGSEILAELARLYRHDLASLPATPVEATCRGMETTLRTVLPPGVELVLSVEADSKVRLHRSELEMVLLELVLQAGASLDGGGRVRLLVDRAEGTVVLAVRFQSAGPTVGHSVGEPGRASGGGRLDDPHALGLFVAREVVDGAGGSWTVTARDERRTEVTIELPEAPVAPAPSSRGPMRAVRRARGSHVCVVDDNVHVLRAIQVPLELAGFRVTAFDDPVQAVEWCRATDSVPEVLVTDVVMPKMTGRQLADALQRSFPELQVLFVSGYTDDVVLRRGVDGAVENLLVKPFTKQELLTRVDALLSAR